MCESTARPRPTKIELQKYPRAHRSKPNHATARNIALLDSRHEKRDGEKDLLSKTKLDPRRRVRQTDQEVSIYIELLIRYCIMLERAHCIMLERTRNAGRTAAQNSTAWSDK